MLNARANPGAQDGFTLVELLVAAALMLVVAGGAMGMLTTLAHTEAGTAQRSDTVMQAQVSVERLTRELHQAAAFNFLTSQIVDVNTWVRSGGGSATLVRIRYDCSENIRCRRYEGPVGGALPTTYTTFAQGLRNIDVFTPQPDFLNPTSVDVRMSITASRSETPVVLTDGTDLVNVG